MGADVETRGEERARSGATDFCRAADDVALCWMVDREVGECMESRWSLNQNYGFAS